MKVEVKTIVQEKEKQKQVVDVFNMPVEIKTNYNYVFKLTFAAGSLFIESNARFFEGDFGFINLNSQTSKTVLKNKKETTLCALFTDFSVKFIFKIIS